jgi:hypothetical protein
MHPRIADQVAMQQTAGKLLRAAVEGLSDEQLRRKGSPSNNDMLWIAAHLATVRHVMARMLGLDVPIPWEARFGRGAEARDPEPPIAEILARFDEASAALMDRYERLRDDDLNAPCGRFPSTDQTVGGAIHFLTFHDGYHLGQLGFLRKMAGGSRVVG